jgi:anti-anti-sigma regulatory factor
MAGSKPVFFALIAPRDARGREDAEAFAEEIEDALAAGSTRLLVDLTNIQRVRTCIFNTLLSARGRLLPDGGRIALVVSPGLRRFVEVTGLDRRFLVANDRLAAAQLLGLLASVPERSVPPRTARAA